MESLRKIDFNRGWSVQKEGESKSRAVNLPDDAMLREKRSETSLSGSAGAFFDGGKYFYKKEFEITKEQIEKTHILEFEGVYQNAEVLLNGEKISERPYGYTNFFVELTGKLKEGRNELLVIADNSKLPNTRWYSGSGIYRQVFLYVADGNYIKPEGIRITTINKEEILVQVDAQKEADIVTRVEISMEGNVSAEAAGNECRIQIPNAKLWSGECPNLYKCKASLVRGKQILDTAEVSFGMRTLSWGKEGFLVNGKSVLLRGACIHHDNGVLGACGFRDAERRRVRLLKEAGFNAVRSSHNPVSKAMLDACDEMGMYVIDELYDMWLIHKNPFDFGKEKFRKWWQKDLYSMISKDYNHASVIMYSIGNEISELGREDGQKMAREMVAFCHEEDRTRPVTAGVNLALAQMASLGNKEGEDKDEQKIMTSDDTKNAPTSEFFNMLMNKMGNKMDQAAATKRAGKIVVQLREIFDIPGYNYATSRYLIDAKECPSQPTVGSETMPHSLYRNWKLVEQLPSLIGDFMWTGWDYLGESGIGTIRYMDKKTKKDVEEGLIISGGAGVIDICGKMRPEVGWNKTIWGLEKNPVIGVNPYPHANHFKSKRMWRKVDTHASWSWEGCEGVKDDVVIYAAAPVVELVVNGKSLGKKKTRENTALFKKIPYEKGKIEAISFNESGDEIGRSRLESAEGNTVIRLTPDKYELAADGQSLCFLEIDLAGENGITKSSSDQKIKVEVEGAGCLQGFGSSRPNMAEDFIHNVHTTYYGKALAVIRAGYEAGTITVKVSGEGLQTKEIKLEVRNENLGI